MNNIHKSNYFALCSIRICSSICLWVDFILIFSTMTYLFAATPTQLAYAATLYGVTTLLFGPMAGKLADSNHTLHFLILSFLLRGSVAFMLFTASSIDSFLIFVFLKGASNLGANAAEVVLTRKMLSDSELLGNVALIGTLDQCIKVLAPLSAGLVMFTSKGTAGFLISAFVALAGLFFTLTIYSRDLSSRRYRPEIRTYGSTQACKMLWRNSAITRLFFICMLAQTAALGVYDALLSLLLKNMGMPSYAFGLTVSFTALGGIVAGLCFTRLYRRHLGWCSSGALFVFGMMLVLIVWVPFLHHTIQLYAVIALFFISGIAYGATSLGFSFALQRYCPAAHLGAVSATARSISVLLLVSGPAVGAWLSIHMELPSVLAACGMVLSFSAICLHVKYQHRYRDEVEQTVADIT